MNAFRDVLDDLASDVRPVDLTARVAAGARRRRQRRMTGLAAVTASVLAVASFAVVTRDPGSDRAQPAAAPGGYDLVWWGTGGGGSGYTLYGRTPEGTERALGGFDSFSADLSPDGTRLAYPSARGMEVLRLGDPVPHVYPDPYVRRSSASVVPVWSPDGRTIAYARTRSGDNGESEHLGFSLLDTVTGATTDVPYPAGRGTPVWSPDGSLLAVSRATPAGTTMGVNIITRDGKLVRLFSREHWFVGSSHAWSPDGKHLLVGDSSRQPAMSMHVVDVVTGEVVRDVPYYFDYVWRDDDRLAWSRGQEVTEVTLRGTVVRRTPFGGPERPVNGGPVLRPAS